MIDSWKISSLCVLLFFLLISVHGLALGHTDQNADPHIGIEERLGQFVPLDSTFRDEAGRSVRLSEVIRKPTILALVYYHCPNVCSLLQQRLAEVLNQIPSEGGNDFEVVSLSFDETETPALARERKAVYLQMIQKGFPPEAWTFLTGDALNIRKVTDAVGFQFKREADDFEHPVSLVLLSQEGKIIRYLYGVDILPFDLKMGLLEASEGRVGPTISKVLRFCFSYDPQGRKYVFNTLKITGGATILLAVSFMVFLLIKGKRVKPPAPKGGAIRQGSRS